MKIKPALVAEHLVPADAALVETTFRNAIPSEFIPFTNSAVRSAGRRVVADRAVAGVVAEVVYQVA